MYAMQYIAYVILLTMEMFVILILHGAILPNPIFGVTESINANRAFTLQCICKMYELANYLMCHFIN